MREKIRTLWCMFTQRHEEHRTLLVYVGLFILFFYIGWLVGGYI